MTFAAQYRVSPLLMGLIILHGVNATAMSPLNSYGAVTKSVLEKSGLADVSIWSVFTLFLAMYVLLMAVVYFAFGGMHLIRHGHGEEPAVDGVDTTVERTKITGEQKVTLLAIAALMVLALGFGLDVGITAFGLGALLTLFFPKRADGAVKGISWSVILLTSGLFVFVGVAKEVGAIDYASNAIGSLGNPLITTLLAFVIGGVVSAFASTTATLGATFPILIPPLQAANFAHIPGAVAGFGVAASVVDVSPTSPSGAMLMANVRNRDKQVYFRQLLSYAGAMLVSGSLVPWFLLVVLGLG
ncbi:SLC13 family permease [Saccharopolyspora elongata]|nr:SLC13 family permease [Saccharopolyspora elongata]